VTSGLRPILSMLKQDASATFVRRPLERGVGRIYEIHRSDGFAACGRELFTRGLGSPPSVLKAVAAGRPDDGLGQDAPATIKSLSIGTSLAASHEKGEHTSRHAPL